MRPNARRLLVAAIVPLVVLHGCESASDRVTAPSGSAAFARFRVIGGALSMGVRSDGLIAESQGTSWAAMLAARTGAVFAQAMLRSPGCSPPLVAPLMLGRRLSGATTATRDSSCAGTSNTLQLPADNLSIAGATAWAALNLSPKIVAASPAAYDIADRQRYPLVLASTQSQVTGLLVGAPTFVAIELGLGEVARAATSGLVVTATSYTQLTAWTFAPATLFAPAFDQVADSVAKTGAKAVVLSVPRITSLPAFRAASAVWAERAALATYGVTVQADCEASPNTLHVGVLVPARVVAAVAAGAAQALSCADVPNTADNILTPGDVAAIDAGVAQMNAHLSQTAAAKGWAFANLDDAFSTIAGGAGAYSSKSHLTCSLPYGYFGSLDGIHPSAAGHSLIADAVASAVNEKYGFNIPIVGTPLDLNLNPCN